MNVREINLSVLINFFVDREDDRAHRRAFAPPDHHREGREHQLLDAIGVLGRERQLVRAGTDADRVEQAVLARPRDLDGLALRADGIRVQRHGGSFRSVRRFQYGGVSPVAAASRRARR